MILIQAWVLISATGLILSAYLTVQSWRDIVALGGGSNGRLLVARSRFAREGLRATVQWTWLLLGAAALLAVNLGPLVVLGLLYGNVVLAINSLIDARTRTLIYRSAARGETLIEREDRLVGDTRRELQAEAADEEPKS